MHLGDLCSVQPYENKMIKFCNYTELPFNVSNSLNLLLGLGKGILDQGARM